jgi:outer membrane lipoprotein carrier protein
MRILLSILAITAFSVGSPALPGAQSALPNASDLAVRTQKRYESIRDFTADFTQTYRGLLQKRTVPEQGTILLKKPNRVRFTYKTPDRKEFVSDGSQFYSYYAQERVGSVYPLPKPNESSTALMFLAGRGDLARDFTASLPADQVPDEWHLRLVPKSKQVDFDTLTLFLDRTTLALRGFVTTDDQGTSTIRFAKLKENTGLADRAFLFEFPKGTEISR